VTDEAGVVSADVRRSLSERLARYERESGHQVIVWIGRSSGDQSIEQFAVDAFEAWGVGNDKLGDGLALFVLVEDRKLRVEVGYGLEPTVTDLLSDRIIRETIVPRIEAGDWDGAIVGGTEALVDTVEGRPGALGGATQLRERGPPQRRDVSTAEIVVMVVLGIGFLILLVTNPRLALWLLFLIGRGGGGGFRGGGGLGGGFRGRGGRSGGGGATGGW
jgi:uncharacterized protein